jgi:two-component system chemotaxis sensor kinase CheA
MSAQPEPVAPLQQLLQATSAMAAATTPDAAFEALVSAVAVVTEGPVGLREADGSWMHRCGTPPTAEQPHLLVGPSGEMVELHCASDDGAVALLVEQAQAVWSSIGTYQMLESMVADEMATVVRREASIQLILDSMGDALVGASVDGSLTEIRSATAEQWFGAPEPGDTLWSYLRRDDPDAAESLRLGFLQLTDAFFPFEVAAAQLPSRFQREGRWFGLAVRPVEEGDELVGVVASVSDATAAVEAERAQADSRELVAVVQQLVADPEGTRNALAELEHLVRSLSGAPIGAARRDLHTLKGGAAVMGLARLAGAAHEAENDLERGAPVAASVEPVAAEAAATWERLAPVMGDGGRRLLQISPASLDELLARVHGDAELTSLVSSWRNAPLQSVLSQITQRLQLQASKLGKQLRVVVHETHLHAPSEEAERFVRTLVHVGRNCVAHGLELPSDRAAAGKSETGTLRVGCWRAGQELVVRVADDGPGVDWHAVRRRAEALGVPHDSHEDLVNALFCAGLSTRVSADELSGRGEGLGAVRAALDEAGGTVAVEATPGLGTTFTFRLPFTSPPGS